METTGAKMWLERVRSATTRATPGPCPLDLTVDNILLYTHGGNELVLRELSLLPPLAFADAKRATEDLRLAEAFEARKELVSLKKVYLTMYKEHTTLERALRQQAAFFRQDNAPSEDDDNDDDGQCHADRKDGDSGDGDTGAGSDGAVSTRTPRPPSSSFVNRPRLHEDACDALAVCRGLSTALHDGRTLTKAICCVPRHPDDVVGPMRQNEDCPEQQHEAGVAAGAAGAAESGFVGKQRALFWSLRSWKMSNSKEEPRNGVPSVGSSGEVGDDLLGKDRGHLVDSGNGSSGAAPWSFYEAIDSCLGHRSHEPLSFDWRHPSNAMYAAFVRQVLISRGAAKALLVREEASRFHAALCEVVVPSLERLRQRGTSTNAGIGCGGGNGSDDDQTPRAVKERLRRREMASKTNSDNNNDDGKGDGGNASEAAAAPLPAKAEAPRQSPELAAAIRAHNQSIIVGTCLAAVKDLAKWLGHILSTEAASDGSISGGRLFVAGDKDAASATSMVVPSSFVASRLQREMAAAAARGEAAMMRQLAESGWPTWLSRGQWNSQENNSNNTNNNEDDSDGKTKGGDGRLSLSAVDNASRQELVCGACGRMFSKLWVHRGICCECDSRLRREGVCPYAPPPAPPAPAPPAPAPAASAPTPPPAGAQQGGKAKKGGNKRGNKGGNRSGGGACCPATFCPHARKCVVHDVGWSGCDRCRFHRGDGEDVEHLFQRLRPAAVFLDFDRTLSSTRKGGSPLQGNHSVDEHLAGICRAALLTSSSASVSAGAVNSAIGTDADHPEAQQQPHCEPTAVHVVTRNSFRRDIRAFLRSKGLPVLDEDGSSDSTALQEHEGEEEQNQNRNQNQNQHAQPPKSRGIQIHTVIKHQSKADVICDPRNVPPGAMASQRTVLFVDDSLAEHLDPRFADHGHIHRVLFLRGR